MVFVHAGGHFQGICYVYVAALKSTKYNKISLN